MLQAPVLETPTMNGHSDGTGAVATDTAPTGARVVAASVTTRRICISGFAEATREVANRQPKEVEVWALNRCYAYLKRWDRWYEVHEPELYTGNTGLRESGYLEMLAKTKVPVYMLNLSKDLPGAIQYPYREICERFRDYFTNSIGYMLAHAAYEHVTGKPIAEVLICGVDMAAYSEYNEQRPCVEYWLGILDGLGIKVTVPSESPLLKAAVTYGKRDRAVLWSAVKGRMALHKTKQAELLANMNAISGILGDADQLLKGLDDKTIPDPVVWLKARRKELQGAHAQTNADLNAEIGALRESQHMLTVVNAPQSPEEEPDIVRTAK